VFLFLGSVAQGGQLAVSPVAVSPVAVSPFEFVNVESSDEECRVSWKINGDALGVEGVKIFRILPGPQMRHGKNPLKEIEDVGSSTSWTADDLTNGEQYSFILEAYGAGDEKRGSALIYAYPGISKKGNPGKVRNLYASVGDKVVAIFWDKAIERDVVAYEVFREQKDGAAPILLGHLPKIQEIRGEKKGGIGEKRVRLLRPCFLRDDRVANGQSYRYGLRAVDADGNLGPVVLTDWVVPGAPGRIRPEELLLLVNENSRDSKRVAKHYAQMRNVPEKNIIFFDIPRKERAFDYERDLAAPLRSHLLENGLAGKIRVLVTCYGIPLRVQSRALDSKLADLFDRLTWGRVMGTANPYFGKRSHFDGTLATYLVSRLDGPTPEIASSLVDKAMLAEKTLRANSGRAYFVSDTIGRQGAEAAKRVGVQATVASHEYTKQNFISDDTLWCFAWGHPYKRIRRTPWPDGAVVAWLKSDSLHRLHFGKGKPGYWCEGLLAEGVTATFGAVVEPYREGFTRGDIFFERFWSGEFSFAEAIGMATPTVQWAMSAVGDPLYTLGWKTDGEDVAVDETGEVDSIATQYVQTAREKQ